MTSGPEDQATTELNYPSHAELTEELRLLRAEIRSLGEELERLRAPASQALVPDATPTDTVPGSSELWAQAVRAGSWLLARANALRTSLLSKRGVEWSPGGLKWDVVALALLVILAAVLRLDDLSTVPLGLQGDEASTGLEARRIRDSGWIGVYSPVAAGNPTGYYYLAAATTALFGESIFGVRMLPALLGILTVAALYILIRRNLGFISAIVGSAFLAVSLWHIIFSRIAHVTIAWPLAMVLAAIALMEALRSGSWRWWAAAGALNALGVYLYNGHTLVLAIVAFFVAVHLFGWPGLIAVGGFAAAIYLPGLTTFMLALTTTAVFAMSPVIRSRTRITAAVAFGGAFILLTYPMMKFIATKPDDYFGRSRMLSLFNSEDWAERTTRGAQIRFLASRYVDSWERLSFDPVPSVVDITGVVPLVTPAALGLCAVGLALGLVRRFGPLVQLGALIVLAMPLVPAVFTDVALRRALVIIPFLAMFAGIAVAEILAIGWRRRVGVRIAATVLVVAVMAWITYRNIDGFNTTMDSPTERWTLGPDLVEASSYLDDLPADTYVYFYSNRWPFHYEVIRFLAPDAQGETRGPPYGPDTFDIDPAKGQPVFVLVGAHRELLPEVQARYPGGTVIEGPYLPEREAGPTYIAYVLPQP